MINWSKGKMLEFVLIEYELTIIFQPIVKRIKQAREKKINNMVFLVVINFLEMIKSKNINIA